MFVSHREQTHTVNKITNKHWGQWVASKLRHKQWFQPLIAEVVLNHISSVARIIRKSLLSFSDFVSKTTLVLFFFFLLYVNNAIPLCLFWCLVTEKNVPFNTIMCSCWQNTEVSLFSTALISYLVTSMMHETGIDVNISGHRLTWVGAQGWKSSY